MNEFNKDEYSIIFCKSCKKECKRYYAGKYPSGKDKKYVDEQGGEFCGLKCPTCHKATVAQRKRLNQELKRLVKESESNE